MDPDPMEILNLWINGMLAPIAGALSEEDRLVLKDTLLGVRLESLKRGYVSIPEGQEPVRLVKGKRVSNKRTRYTLKHADLNLHQAQLAFIVDALGLAQTKLLFKRSLLFVTNQPGSRLAKVADGRAPTQVEIREYVDELFASWSEPNGVVFDTGKAGGEWQKIAMYRCEAIVAICYVLLRLLSYDSGRWANWWQNSKVYKKHFVERIREGEAKRFSSSKQNVPKHLLRDDKKIVRHIHPDVIFVMFDVFG